MREVEREVVEVGHGGAAPAVDRLAGVSDGGDGVPGPALGAAAEEGGEQQPLGDGGVLVLVEQHHPEFVAQDRADLGAGERQLGGERDLVAEVEEVAALLGLAVAPGQPEQFASGLGGLGDPAQLGVAEPGRFERGQEGGVVLGELVGAYEVLGELGVERQQIADQCGERPGQGGVRAGGLAQHTGGELVAGGVGEEAGGGFESDAQPVLGEESAGERVVRGDAGLARGLSGSMASGSVTPAAIRALRTRSASSPAALLVNVSPRTCSGATWPVPTSHTTRAAITVVFPDPAPATITCGAGGAVMQAVCSGVNGIPRSSLSCSGSVIREDTPERLTGRTDNRRHRRTSAPVHPFTRSPAHPLTRSLQDVAALGLGAARGPEGAVCAVLAGGGGEAFVQDPAGRGGQQVGDPLTGERFLCLHLGQGVSALLLGGGLAQLYEFGAAGLGAPAVEDVVDRAFPDGQLVHSELGVAGDLVLGRGLFAGLEVDDVGPALGVLFDAVHGAPDAHLVLPAPSVTSKSCSLAAGVRAVRSMTCQRRKRSRAARACSFSCRDFQGASKTSPSQTESSRSIRTARSAGVRPEATSSASTWTTLPKPCAAVAGASAFTSRPRNHWSAQVLASWSSALPERATGWSRSRSGTAERVGSYRPHQR